MGLHCNLLLMPITPFHLGPGLLCGVLVESSLAAFVATTVVIDCESGYHLLSGHYPVHRFLHTLVGATLIAVVIAVLLGAIEGWRRRHRGTNPDGTRRAPASLGGIAAGAVAAAWSHVILDGVMHDDMRPFAPVSDANPLHGALPLTWLHLACVAAGVLAVLIFMRQWGRVRC
jgi:hypothetical protein